MKPRIVDLEKKGLEWCCEYDLAKLLRLARAARVASEALEEECDEWGMLIPQEWAALREALDAIDWDD